MAGVGAKRSPTTPCVRPRRRPSTASGAPTRTDSCAPRASMSVCRPGRWAIPRSATSISAPAASSCRICRASARPSPAARSRKAPALADLIGKLKQSGGTCHLIGLVSPGGVHSHQDHAVALAKILADAGVPTVVHALTDGRDTPPQSAAEDLAVHRGAAASGSDRHRGAGAITRMDRDKRWERVVKAYDAIVGGRGPALRRCASGHRRCLCAQEVYDEFIMPAVIGDYRGMKDGDGVLCFNFRADRVREILGAMLDPAFLRLCAQAHRALRRGSRHGAVQRCARQIHGDDLSAADLSEHPRRSRRRTPAARSCAWRRPRNIRTSPTSSTAAARSRSPARTASWCRRPRSRPTICSPKCRRPN